MSQTLTVSDALYARLEAAARSRGLSSIEQLLEQLNTNSDELRRRQEVVREIETLRARLSADYGQMPDSVELVREDRVR